MEPEVAWRLIAAEFLTCKTGLRYLGILDFFPENIVVAGSYLLKKQSWNRKDFFIPKKSWIVLCLTAW